MSDKTISRMTDISSSEKGATKMLAVNDEQIEQFALLRALARISDRHWEIAQTGYEDEEWSAHRVTGSVNDREWKLVAKAPTLISLLTILGGAKFNV